LDVSYDCECFCGEEILLQRNDDGFVRGFKPDAQESFRMHFYSISAD